MSRRMIISDYQIRLDNVALVETIVIHFDVCLSNKFQ